MTHLRIVSASLIALASGLWAEDLGVPAAPQSATTGAVAAAPEVAANTVAVWDAGSGSVGGAASPIGTQIATATPIEIERGGPARLVLPGTVHGVITAAAGSRFVLSERRVESGGQTQGELIVTLERGAIEISGDLVPRYAGARIRGAASETVVGRGTTLTIERDGDGDTLVAVEGSAMTGPLPQAANGWQAVGERVTLESKTSVRVTTTTGVSEASPAPVRPQLLGTASERMPVRAQAQLTQSGHEEDLASYTSRYGSGSDAWTLDAAGRSLGTANNAYWAAPVAPPRTQAAERPISGVFQVSGFRDSNPTASPDDVGGEVPDSAFSFYGDLRWKCWHNDSLALRLQGVGSVVRYRDTETANAAQGGLSAALLGSAEAIDWSIGIGGVVTHSVTENRRVGRISGDIGHAVGERDYTVVNIGVGHSTILPANSDTYTARALTVRPAWLHSWPGEVWTPSTEVSLLYTDSRSAVATDDYYALRPGLTWLNHIGSLDVTLAGRSEFVSYREHRYSSEDGFGREIVSQLSAGADYWLLPWWSLGAFANRLWFVSNQDSSSYTDTQIGARTTVTW